MWFLASGRLLTSKHTLLNNRQLQISSDELVFLAQAQMSHPVVLHVNWDRRQTAGVENMSKLWRNLAIY